MNMEAKGRDEKTKAYVTLTMPRDLKARLDNMRWERRAPSLTGMLRDLLTDCADRHEKEGQQPEMVS